jgi:hypothetical protein
MSGQRNDDAGAQLDAALQQLTAAMVAILQPAVEWLLQYVEACARLIERIGALPERLLRARAARRRRRDLDALGRAVYDGMAAGIERGRQLRDELPAELQRRIREIERELSAQLPAGLSVQFDAGRQLPDLAGQLDAGEIPTPAGAAAAAGPELAGEIGQLPAGYAADDLHPSHEFELISDNRMECSRCGICSCCDRAEWFARPCDVA